MDEKNGLPYGDKAKKKIIRRLRKKKKPIKKGSENLTKISKC